MARLRITITLDRQYSEVEFDGIQSRAIDAAVACVPVSSVIANATSERPDRPYKGELTVHLAETEREVITEEAIRRIEFRLEQLPEVEQIHVGRY